MNCGHCRAATDSTYLCRSCTTTLDNNLGQLPWLLDELDNRIARLDTISRGTLGRTRGNGGSSIVDFDAAELARTIRRKILRWVTEICHHHTGRTPPGLSSVTTSDLARWLKHNTVAIAAFPNADKLYNDIAGMVGSGDQPGQLVEAINPNENHLVGPCPTPTGNGHRQCGRILYADTYAKTTTCPTCGQTIDVEQTRLATAKERDLHTETALLQLLTDIGEPLSETQLDTWIRIRRLRPAGYQHNNTITAHRINPTDQPVYSINQTRRLNRKHAHQNMHNPNPAALTCYDDQSAGHSHANTRK